MSAAVEVGQGEGGAFGSGSAPTAGAVGKADLGLLLVHGIGRQKPGDGIDQVANALLEWLRSRDRSRLVRIESARLKDKDGPSQAVIAYGPPDAANLRPDPTKAKRILLVESFWAEEFDPPGFLDVLSWMLGPGAWLLFRELVCVPRWRWPVLRRASELHRPRWTVPLGLYRNNKLLTIAGGWIGVGALLFVVLPFQVFGALLAILWLVPFGPIRNLATGVFRVITEQLGDSFVFARDPVVRRAIADRVARDLAHVDAEKTVVVAHSQGAAVALDMLENLPAEPPALVTYGAGIRKLQETLLADRQASSTPAVFYGLWWLSVMAVAAYVGLVTALAGLVSAPSPNINYLSHWGWLSYVVIVGVGVLGYRLGTIAARRDDAVDEVLTRRIGKHLERQASWLDIYAGWDFVPAGPLVRHCNYVQDAETTVWQSTKTRDLCTLRVVNMFNPFKDHNAYWENTQGFIDPVMSWLHRAGSVSWLPDPFAPHRDTISNRDWRVTFHLFSSLILFALVIALFVVAGDGREALIPLPTLLAALEWIFGDGVVAAFDRISAEGWWLAWLPSLVTGTLVLALHLAVLGVYGTLVTGPVWRSLDRQLSLNVASGWDRTALFWALLYVALVALAAWVLFEAVKVDDNHYWQLVAAPVSLFEAIGCALEALAERGEMPTDPTWLQTWLHAASAWVTDRFGVELFPDQPPSDAAACGSPPGS